MAKSVTCRKSKSISEETPILCIHWLGQILWLGTSCIHTCFRRYLCAFRCRTSLRREPILFSIACDFMQKDLTRRKTSLALFASLPLGNTARSCLWRPKKGSNLFKPYYSAKCFSVDMWLRRTMPSGKVTPDWQFKECLSINCTMQKHPKHMLVTGSER